MEYPIVIKNSRGVEVDRVANADTANAVLYGDLSARDGGQYTIEVPEGEEWDRAALLINGEIRLQADCWGFVILDRLVRV